MKKTSIVILAILMILPGFSLALAQGASFTISCTIPSIAGVNAPIIEEKSTRTQDQQAAQAQVANLPKDIKTPVASMLQTEKEVRTQAAAPMLVQTFYVR